MNAPAPAPVSTPVPTSVAAPTLAPATPAQMVLAVDLDAVFLAGDDEDRLHLYQLISRHPSILLIFLTGRSQEAVMPLLDDPTLPMPAYLICDAGATIADARNHTVGTLQAEIDGRWPGEHVVSEALAGLPELQRQDVPQRNRCAYFCEPQAVTPELMALLERLGCNHRYTHQRFLDVLPRGVSPYRSLVALVEHLQLSPDSVMLATEALNALELAELPNAFKVVEVPQHGADPSAQTPAPRHLHRHVMRAGRRGCGAVLEAMAHFGFLGEKALRALAHRKAPEGEAELVVVYHRLPYEESVQNGKVVRRRPQSPNGIIPTLLSFFNGGVEGSWVAWSIHDEAHGPFEIHTPVDAQRFPNLTAARVKLTKEQVDIFYKRFSKEAFWPVLHTFWERASFNEDDWNVFVEVNRAFAETSAREAALGATVWLHDYNLWMVPAFLRELRPDVRIAFFHHTHFPSADVFNVLPWRRQIVGSLLQCDYIGFHIPRQVENFVDVVRGMAPVEVLSRTGCAPRFMTYGSAVGLDQMSTAIRVHERTVHLGAHPVGLDLRRISEALATDKCRALRDEIEAARQGKRLILSVERLDYTKGILEKLLAYESLLEQNPEWHGQVSLVTICVPAAKEMSIYDELLTQIEQVAGRINGRFSRVGWVPLHFYFRSFSFEEVTAFYASADVMWITPLCDGLNLVALEYAATQGEGERNGVLVLSEFAGAAAVLKDAILTNPHDPKDLRERLLQALNMDDLEAQTRMRNLNDTVRYYHLQRWGQDFLDAVAQTHTAATTTNNAPALSGKP